MIKRLKYYARERKSFNKINFLNFRLNITSLGPSKGEMGLRMLGEGKLQRGEGEGGRAREGEGEGRVEEEEEEEEGGKGGEEEIKREIRRGELKVEEEEGKVVEEMLWEKQPLPLLWM